MTFIFDFGIDILKLCLRTKNKVSKSRLSKVRPQIRQTDTQTHTQTDRQTDQTHYHAAFAAGEQQKYFSRSERVWSTKRSWRHRQAVDTQTCRQPSLASQDHWTTGGDRHQGRQTLEDVDSQQRQARACALLLWATTYSLLFAGSAASVALCLSTVLQTMSSQPANAAC